jgi:cytochrome oxidase Cu insertion factor (SCO1/SenC/PrrC family)
MIRRIVAAGVVLAAISGAALSGVVRAATPDFAAFQIIPYEPPKPAPELALPDLDGKAVKLQDFRGKVLLVFFWATW